MIKLKSNFLLNQLNNLRRIIRLRRTPNNKLKHIFQTGKELNEMFPETNVDFEFFIQKKAILPWNFITKNTCVEHASIKRNNKSSFIYLLFKFLLFFLQIAYLFQFLF